MNKEFIPYEEALALKELGFNEECLGYWVEGINQFYIDYEKHLNNKHWMFTSNDGKNRDKMCTAPLYQEAFRWFREKYDLPVRISRVSGIINYTYIAEFYEGDDANFVANTATYEEAELACLRKLIEIAKNK